MANDGPLTEAGQDAGRLADGRRIGIKAEEAAVRDTASKPLGVPTATDRAIRDGAAGTEGQGGEQPRRRGPADALLPCVTVPRGSGDGPSGPETHQWPGRDVRHGATGPRSPGPAIAPPAPRARPRSVIGTAPTPLAPRSRAGSGRQRRSPRLQRGVGPQVARDEQAPLAVELDVDGTRRHERPNSGLGAGQRQAAELLRASSAQASRGKTARQESSHRVGVAPSARRVRKRRDRDATAIVERVTVLARKEGVLSTRCPTTIPHLAPFWPQGAILQGTASPSRVVSAVVWAPLIAQRVGSGRLARVEGDRDLSDVGDLCGIAVEAVKPMYAVPPSRRATGADHRVEQLGVDRRVSMRRK